MPPTSSPPSFLRPFLGTLLVVAGLLVASACGPTQSATAPSADSSATRTLRLTAFDSTTGEPLDSARAANRTFGDSLRTDSGGTFVLRDVEPALYVFDVGGYGYHTQRFVSVLVEPEDTTSAVSTSLLPKRLTINCQDNRPYFWGAVVRGYEEDSTRTRLKLIDVFAKDGEVQVQPVVVNDLSSPIFLPDNFGALGHYEIVLYDGNSNRLSYTYEDAPPDQGHRVYEKGDILPVVPKDLKRLEPSTLIVGDSVDKGTTIFARMRYTFSTDDTLRATSATTFPDLELDSLQTPVFDTLRTDGLVEVPDSLVLQRDTTVMEVVGIDTTVTRSGYTLFSTLRDGNAVSSARAARNLLYVPDSVVTRSRRDSLRALARADTTVPPIDTAAVAVAPDTSLLQIVKRTNTSALRSLLTDQRLVQSLSNGLPTPDLPADSLLSFSSTFRRAYLQTPSLSTMRVRRGLDTVPDSARTDSVILSAPVSDSLFRVLDGDSLAADTTRSPEERNPFVRPDPSTLLAPDTDSITIDSLALTVGPEADSVVTTTIPSNTLTAPPTYSYWHLPASLSRTGSRLLVVDSSFFRLRARPSVDTTAGLDVAGLLPDRVGRRSDEGTVQRYPQQVVRAPAGTYRSDYLRTWKMIQEDRLQRHYCEVFPFPLRSDWRSASMQ
jgi:hypothetical protein